MSIVIAGDVVLAEDESGVTENNPRLGYHSLVSVTNVQADEEAEGYPVVNVATPVLYQKWRGSTDAEQAITIDCGSSETVNYFAVAGHNLGSIGTTIKFQSSANGSDWTDETDERILANDFAFLEEFADATARYFRLLITPEADTVPEVAVLHVGRVLRVQRRIYVGHSPATLSRRTTVTTGRSETGQPLGRVVTSQYFETAAALRNLTPDWLRDRFEPFMTAAENGYFFWAWRPGEYPDEVLYGSLTDDPRPTNQLGNGYMAVELSIQGVR